MNKVATIVLSSGIGFIVGSIATYIFIKKKYEGRYYDELHKAIDEECERLRARHQKKDFESIIPDDEEKIFERPNAPIDDDSDNPYQQKLEAINSGVEEMEEPVEESQGPRFIDEDEFRFLPPKYEIRELQYLSIDGTVLDENDEIVEEPQIYISGLEETLKGMNHYETAYILVESIGVACEVVVLRMTYQDVYT